MTERLKILISAYACSPKRGSEPGMAWNIVNEIGKYHEVHIITEAYKWRKGIEDKLIAEPALKENLKFYFIYKRRNKPLRKIWPPSYYWFYKEWQKKAYFLAMELDRKEKFDIVHQLNMIGFREPGYLWKFNDKPVIWGPVGGFAQMAWSYVKDLTLKDIVYYSARNLLNSFQMKYSRRIKKMAKRSTVIISATSDAREGLLKYLKRSSLLINETGAKPQQMKYKISRESVLKIIWVGRMEGRKAMPLALCALARLPSNVNYKFHIVGGGPRLDQCRKMSERLGINSKCIFYGESPYAETQHIIAASDILLFTSLQEGTPHVVLEALSYGLPVICHDANGHGDVVNDKCGIKIQMVNPEKSIKWFSEAIIKLYNDRDLLERLSIGSFERARELSWESIGLQICSAYQEAIDKQNLIMSH